VTNSAEENRQWVRSRVARAGRTLEVELAALATLLFRQELAAAEKEWQAWLS
jgi:hypothetical protein